MAEEFNNGGKNRDHNDGEYHKGKVLFDKRQVTEVVSPEYKNSYPGGACRDVIERESPMRHEAETGHKRCERPDYGDKSRYDNRLSAMFLVKTVRAVKIFSVQKTDIFFVEHLWPDKISYPIVRGIPCDSGEAEQAE